MKLHRAIALAATLACMPTITACADVKSAVITTKEKQPMTVPSSSRPSAPVVAPIEHAGVRYEQDSHDDRAGDQPGGYLAAIDSKTGSRLWRLKVYEIQDQRAAGLPTFARHFRSMTLTPDGAALDIENETGAVYRVDLTKRTSTFISGPPNTSPPEPLVPPKPRP